MKHSFWLKASLSIICIMSVGSSIEVQDFNSGITTKISPLNIDFNALYDSTNAIYNVVERDSTYILWNYTTTSGDWAYVFKDGRVAVGSTRQFSLETKDTLLSDLNNVMIMLNKAGAGISDEYKGHVLDSSTYYAPEKEIYHWILYDFSSNFALNLFVPDCTIKAARLTVSGCDASNGGWDSGNPGQLYNIDSVDVSSCSQYYDCCYVPSADITSRIPSGKHRIYSDRVNAAHRMVIEAITSPMPSKNFTLYSDDYQTVWINEMNKSKSLDKFYEFIFNDSIEEPKVPCPGNISIDKNSFPLIKLSAFFEENCSQSGNLTKDDIDIQENGADVQIEDMYFTGKASGQGLDLAFVIDISGSMGDEIDILKSRIQNLTDQITEKGLDARYSLLTFVDKPETAMEWTSDSKSFKQVVDGISVSSGTPNLPENAIEGIEQALSFGFRPSAQKIMIVITDELSSQKGDGSSLSEHTEDEAKDDLSRAGVTLIAVSPDFRYFDPGVPRQDMPKYSDMKVLAEKTGGIAIDINSAEFLDILKRIEGILSETYIISYKTSNTLPGTENTVNISVGPCNCEKSVNYTSLA